MHRGSKEAGELRGVSTFAMGEEVRPGCWTRVARRAHVRARCFAHDHIYLSKLINEDMFNPTHLDDSWYRTVYIA
jgi:hypothetical protein